MTGDGLIIRAKTYREQVRILGLANWVRLNGGRLWGKGAKPGSRLTVSTPLALHPLAMRAHTSDMFVFTQIFSHREYECLDHVDEASLIVDCGANVGYSSAYFLSRFPKAHLIAIEPDPNNFAVLKENLKPYGKRSTAILAGVWSSMTGLVISHPRLGAREEWGVTVRPARADEEPQIMAVDLGTVLEESNFDRISILKVDIEGSEREIFASNTAAWIDKVDHLVVELHDEECRRVVMAATEGLQFDVFEWGELTVFTRDRR